MSFTTWNRLGNTTQTTNSEVGVNGTENGSPSYDSDGVILTATTKYISFNASISKYQGAISFWWKPNFASTSTSVHSLIDTDTSVQRMVLYFSNTGKLLFGHYSTGQSQSPTQTFSAGDKIHIGWSWDYQGIDGGSDTMQLYINGVDCGVAFTADWTVYPTSEDLTIGGWEDATPTFQANATFRNVKIYDKAITDFSNDINTEGFGGAKRRVS